MSSRAHLSGVLQETTGEHMVAAGLYDPRFEHDACGVGFVADLTGRGDHDVVARALRVLCNLEHRGAKGGDPGTGDGAGILTQIPDEFFRATCDFELPEAGAYAAGMAFFSAERHLVTPALARLAAAEGDRKSTRLNSSHMSISYAVFCLK